MSVLRVPFIVTLDIGDHESIEHLVVVDLQFGFLIYIPSTSDVSVQSGYFLVNAPYFYLNLRPQS